MPKPTPAEIVEKLNREINAVVVDRAINVRLLELGSVPLVGSNADFAKPVAEETGAKWSS